MKLSWLQPIDYLNVIPMLNHGEFGSDTVLSTILERGV
jgi:hypothetical protein